MSKRKKLGIWYGIILLCGVIFTACGGESSSMVGSDYAAMDGGSYDRAYYEDSAAEEAERAKREAELEKMEEEAKAEASVEVPVQGEESAEETEESAE